MMPRIFISHSSEDRQQAAFLLAWLRDHGFTSTFLDFDEQHGIGAGADWERTLYRELSSADAVILILTKNWFGSKWCFAEFTQARALGKAIFPLVESPTGESFVSSDIQHLDLIKDREGGLKRLLSELTRIALDARGGFPWDATRPPYPGLLAFDEADAAIYFGRDDDIRRLIERLNARRAQGGEKLVLVLGASGSGKSSLLRAGVVPRLERDAHNWIVLPPFRPQLYPLDELAQVVAAGLGQDTEWRRWRDAFAGGDFAHSLSDLAHDLRASHKQTEAQILLVIDQGEELFAGADPEQTDQFFRVLSALLDERLPFLAAMSVRSDYLGRLQQEPRLEARSEQFLLKSMPLERVREIIEGPAKVVGMEVDEGLVTAAMTDARTEDALPLLAFALRELYDRFASSGRLTAEAYRALGDAQAQLSPLENAVRRKADDVLAEAKPAPEDLDALKEAFIPAMVRVNPEGEYVRRPAPTESMPPRALPLIERLAKARLLTIHDEQGVRMVEVAHEALLRKWPLLRAWLDEEREFLVGKDQLERDLFDWEGAATKQKSDALLTGLKLTRARIWLLAKPHQLSARERSFIQASIERQEAEAALRERARRRHNQAVLGGTITAAFLVILLVAATVGFYWTRQISRSYQLASDALQQRDLDPEKSVLLAIQSVNPALVYHLPSKPAAATALHYAIITSEVRKTLRGHTDKVESVAFSPDGSRLATASDDGTAIVWDVETGTKQMTLSVLHGPAIQSIAFSRDGKYLAGGSDDQTAKIWDAKTGKQLMTLNGHAGSVESVAFSPDGKSLATGSDDKTARIWDVQTGKLLITLSGHTDKVESVAFSPDGRRLATGSDDNTAKIWDALAGRELMTLCETTKKSGLKITSCKPDEGSELKSTIESVAFSPDGESLATGSDDKTARIWDVQTGNLRATFGGPNTPNAHEDRIEAVAFSPDGTHLVTASWDKTAKLWDTTTGDLLTTLRGHQGEVNFVAFSPDGRSLATASDDKTAKIWNAEFLGTEVMTLRESILVTSVAFSPDGRSLATGSDDNTAKIWDAETGRLLKTLKGHENWVFAVAFSPDGKLLATASYDKTARIWDAKSGELLITLSGHEDAVTSVTFSPDGKRVATASADGMAKVWDVQTGKLLRTLSGHGARVRSVTFSPDGRSLATASDDNTAKIWDAETGKELQTLDGPNGHQGEVYSVAFSANGKRLATASVDRTAKVWDAETGKELMTLRGHESVVYSVAFSPDGERLATGSQDMTAKLWDAKTGELLMTLRGHQGQVRSVAFSPDGKRLASASADATVQVYDVDVNDLLTLARSRVTRDLTPAECEQYFGSSTCPKLP